MWQLADRLLQDIRREDMLPTSTWRFLTECPDTPSSFALVGSLSAEGITSKVVSDTVLLGEGRPCRIFVDAAQLHRARQFLHEAEFSEEELSTLAVGDPLP